MVYKITNNDTKTLNRMINKINSDLITRDNNNAVVAQLLNYQAVTLYNQLSALDVLYTAQYRDIYNQIQALKDAVDKYAESGEQQQ